MEISEESWEFSERPSDKVGSMISQLAGAARVRVTGHAVVLKLL